MSKLDMSSSPAGSKIFANAEVVVLKIIVPTEKISKMIQFPSKSTISEMKEIILQKLGLVKLDSGARRNFEKFALFWYNDSGPLWLSEGSSLRSYGLKNKDELQFKERPGGIGDRSSTTGTSASRLFPANPPPAPPTAYASADYMRSLVPPSKPSAAMPSTQTKYTTSTSSSGLSSPKTGPLTSLHSAYSEPTLSYQNSSHSLYSTPHQTKTPSPLAKQPTPVPYVPPQDDTISLDFTIPDQDSFDRILAEREYLQAQMNMERLQREDMERDQEDGQKRMLLDQMRTEIEKLKALQSGPPVPTSQPKGGSPYGNGQGLDKPYSNGNNGHGSPSPTISRVAPQPAPQPARAPPPAQTRAPPPPAPDPYGSDSDYSDSEDEDMQYYYEKLRNEMMQEQGLSPAKNSSHRLSVAISRAPDVERRVMMLEQDKSNFEFTILTAENILDEALNGIEDRSINSMDGVRLYLISALNTLREGR
eukprot:TRINITY_DN382_c0_g1_i3.p1 TRINITY_DN382_c0_g1~~TRINITY_DN382_c0_g1_i3.p1  ORF type:complete len:476 (-),score=115.16 TRINITY_DN382_c0_g1_i3:106-1533(-)